MSTSLDKDGGHGGHGSHRYVESDDSDDGMGFGLFDDGPSIHANTMSRGTMTLQLRP